ncbi:NAD(P)/FAD-dependent oxidoreductase [Cohnella cholangitidis]|uniref:FAD-dependent oxidoreductase n=1 Tax=Cohnella cholangitidis TaxID=2598458 RepID=A0A7G5C393_9BACL|nr:FAD-dependent oxidoreductase [Cohnella cholangitidis]QMV43677.1 FAD-dependent oxidoreductase [Cohnella cholangitidis]
MSNGGANADVIVVGSGPAGLSSAISAAKNGLRIAVLDEYPRAGGRLLGQLHQEPNGKWWNGIEEARRLEDTAREAGVSVRTGVSVTGLERTGDEGWTLWTNAGLFQAKRLLLATGAAESAVPVPGWTLPGVMSIGAAQVMTNVQRVKVGSRGVVIGMNVLAMAIVSELRLAGIDLEAIVLPPGSPVSGHSSDPGRVFGALLKVAHLAHPLFRRGASLIRHPLLQRMALAAYPKGGMRIWGTPLQLRRAALEIVGNDCVEGVRTAAIRTDGSVIAGTEQFIEADFVCIAGGLYPLAELAAVAGCPFRYVPQLGGHIPLHDESMRTPLSRLYVAGNITGVESAKVAMAQGFVAGLAMAFDENGDKPASLAAELELAIARVKQVRREALIQFHPDIEQCRVEFYLSQA